MQVSVRFNITPAPSAPPPIFDVLLRLPERWVVPIAQVYSGLFVYGVVLYLAGWLMIALKPSPSGGPPSGDLLFIAATGWIPFLAVYVGLNALVRLHLHRRIDYQQHAIEELENDFSDVISESVTMVTQQLQDIGPLTRDNDA